MNFITMNRTQIEKGNDVASPHIIISVYNSGDEKPAIQRNEHTLDAIFCQFDDIDAETAGKVLFNKNFAKEVRDLVYKWGSHWEVVICQCEAGQSRSVGLAAALSKFFNGDDSEFFSGSGMYAPTSRTPNMHVYNVMLAMLHEEPLRIYRIVYDWRDDGAEEWEEMMVIAEDEPRALAIVGYDEDKVVCRLIGTAVQGETSTGLICCGTHEYPPFQPQDHVRLAVDFFPSAECGATGKVVGIEFADNRKFIHVVWNKEDGKWHGMDDKFYNAVWFDYAEEKNGDEAAGEHEAASI